MLFPTHFIAVIDSVLTFLQSSKQGLTINSLDVGCYAHADDVRAASISIDPAQIQWNLVDSFCATNSLKLNTSKTELIQFTSGTFTSCSHKIVGQSIQTQMASKCLGVWWKYNLFPSKSVEESVSKARCVFFAIESTGIFHGKLNPLTGRNLFDTFVVPILLCGCETRILSDSIPTKSLTFCLTLSRLDNSYKVKVKESQSQSL